MKVLKTKEEVRVFRNALKSNGMLLGLVPTMGALHRGHLELVQRAAADNQVVMVSIFINPTQFNNYDDLNNYPKSLEADLDKLQKLCLNVSVFLPEVSEMYGNSVRASEYDFNRLDQVMEGAYRPGHFDGVATIVETLLTLILPERAYFGEKDFQQLQIIRRLAQQKKIPVEIIPCPIVREDDGLAMSSRNRLLTKRLREQAGLIYKILQEAKTLFGTKSASEVREYVTKQFDANPDFKLEYFEVAESETLKPLRRKQKNTKYRAFIAAFLGKVRLIDNIALN